MNFRVVSCPVCQGQVVVGEPTCRSCGQLFNYGASPPPVPTPAQIHQALAQAAQQAAATHQAMPAEQPSQPMQQPAGGMSQASSQDSGFIDADRFDGKAGHPVGHGSMEGLEPTHFSQVHIQVATGQGIPGFITTDDELAEKEAQRMPSVPSVQTGDIWNGMLDQSLYGAYVPEEIEVQGLQDVERFDSSHRVRPSNRKDLAASDLVVCSDCGTETRATLCPHCGAKTSTEL